MSWFQKKEREYTPEEALIIAKQQLAPLWYRSAPLVCGTELEGKFEVQPLDPVVLQGTWIFLFAAVTDRGGEEMLAVYREWKKRYASLGVRFIVVFRAHFSLFLERKVLEEYLSSKGIEDPAFMDPDGALCRAFGEETYPRAAILHEGKIAGTAAGGAWLAGMETEIQRILRQGSPGLPLWPALQPASAPPIVAERWVLTERSPDLAKVRLSGRWKLQDNRIVTDDPKAALDIESPRQSVVILAQSLHPERQSTRIHFHSKGSFYSDSFAGEDFSVDDEGRSGVLVGSPRAYAILKDLPAGGLRSTTFIFPNTRVSAMAIYGFEFFD